MSRQLYAAFRSLHMGISGALIGLVFAAAAYLLESREKPGLEVTQLSTANNYENTVERNYSVYPGPTSDAALRVLAEVTRSQLASGNSDAFLESINLLRADESRVFLVAAVLGVSNPGVSGQFTPQPIVQIQELSTLEELVSVLEVIAKRVHDPENNSIFTYDKHTLLNTISACYLRVGYMFAGLGEKAVADATYAKASKLLIEVDNCDFALLNEQRLRDSESSATKQPSLGISAAPEAVGSGAGRVGDDAQMFVAPTDSSSNTWEIFWRWPLSLAVLLGGGSFVVRFMFGEISQRSSKRFADSLERALPWLSRLGSFQVPMRSSRSNYSEGDTSTNPTPTSGFDLSGSGKSSANES